MTYASVILPVPLPKTFSYQVPVDVPVQVGSRVIVQFGPKKIYTGLVANLTDTPPSDGNFKEIIEVLDADPIIDPIQISFFNWIARYYMCTLGEVSNAAIPAGLKLSSESFIHLNPDSEWQDTDFTEREETLLNHLAEGEISLKEAGDILDLKHPQAVVKSLADRRVVHLFEKVKDKYQPKFMRRIRLAEQWRNEEMLEGLFTELAKKPKQEDVLLSYLREVLALEKPKANQRGMAKSKLAIESSTSSIATLVKKGVLEEWSQVISRLPEMDDEPPQIPTLSDIQQLVLKEINSNFESQQTVLLRGITGSGKTEIYLSLIKNELDKGKQVLYLLPEIALTTQIILRLQKVFGNNFGVYHSHYSDSERVEVWNKVLKKEYQLVVGVRSSVFLPFSNLGLIIVDEEHESSFKQFDPAPRYNARDAAIYLALLHKSKTLLGTATPVIDTFHKALSGKFGLVELDERYANVTLPKVELIDMRVVRKRKELKANIFSAQMLQEIGFALEKKEQVILFQNRRGYAPFVSCDDCGHVMGCPNCDVSLTYHQLQNKIICHYCGHNIYMPQECPECGLNHMKSSGFGTEQLEDELQPFFPDATMQRMDLDTTRNKNSYQRILTDFENGETDILIGTQMVSKGLDFDKVNLVGIFDIDRIIHFPDFRSHERAYQLITQVSGRSGRKSGEGKVFIQTHDPDHVVLQKVLKEDYRHFYTGEIWERENFNYPPFYRLIKIIIKHKELNILNDAAIFMANNLRQHLTPDRINGPTDPVINRVRNMYLKEINIRVETEGINIQGLKDFLIIAREEVNAVKTFRSVRVIFDVDPV
ncbi:MAG: primosomal protein N' [Cytophagales bacterium]|nr:primosomal protein N' [Cytophagales bacterium]